MYVWGEGGWRDVFDAKYFMLGVAAWGDVYTDTKQKKILIIVLSGQTKRSSEGLIIRVKVAIISFFINNWFWNDAKKKFRKHRRSIYDK